MVGSPEPAVPGKAKPRYQGMSEAANMHRATQHIRSCGAIALSGSWWFGYYYFFTWSHTGLGGNND